MPMEPTPNQLKACEEQKTSGPLPHAAMRLLYDEGFTIAGARRHLNEAEGNGSVAAHAPNGSGPVAVPAEGPDAQISRKMLLELRDSLRSFLTLLERK